MVRGQKKTYIETQDIPTPVTYGPVEPFATDIAICLLLSSQALRAFNNCRILSRLPCLTSLILTLPILTSLSSRKSNSLNRPSSLSSLDPVGKAESGTDGDDGFPLIDSANRRRARPPHIDPVISTMRRAGGKWEFAHSIKSSSIYGAMSSGMGHQRGS